ncbi:MAG: hypothetical protein K2K81_08140 [Muribaculaceae bacterium]|nr:hypothetical protein [Muribaculaceae bacterium]
MKFKFTLLFIIFINTCCSISSSAVNLVEPGKIWWYESARVIEASQELHFDKVTLGLTLKAPESQEAPEWHPCYAVDSLEQNVIDVPICHLKESYGKVWVKPNLELCKIDVKNCSDELYILSIFLGYWGGNKIIQANEHNYEDDPDATVWNKDPERTEFLLYDFNYNVGDAYRWPWSGINFSDPSFKDDQEVLEPIDRGFFITKIEDEEATPSYDDNEKRKIFTIKQAEEKFITYGKPISDIVEGIGITKGEVCSYYSSSTSWFGFFICPASICLPALSSWFTLPWIPELMAVIASDGTQIYGDPDYKPSAGVKEITLEKFKDNKIFNLHGREVSNPLPGSIYIRNGKKFVAK